MDKRVLLVLVVGGLIVFGIVWMTVIAGKKNVTDKIQERNQYMNELLESGQ